MGVCGLAENCLGILGQGVRVVPVVVIGHAEVGIGLGDFRVQPDGNGEVGNRPNGQVPIQIDIAAVVIGFRVRAI